MIIHQALFRFALHNKKTLSEPGSDPTWHFKNTGADTLDQCFNPQAVGRDLIP